MTIAALGPPLRAVPAGSARGLDALLAEITVPRTLPPRANGRPLKTVSVSSYELWQQCEEKWRRRYLLGEPTPTSPVMYLGTAVDNALTWMYEQRMAGQEPEPGDVLAAYERMFEAHEDHSRVAWTEFESEGLIRSYGTHCVDLYVEKMAPLSGRPIAVQREISFKLNDACEWRVTGYVDLESERDVPVQITDGGLVIAMDAEPPDGHEVVATRPEGSQVVEDYKVKGSYISLTEANGLIQPGTYLLDRRLGERPADEFVFANLVRPGGNRADFGGRLIHTTRSDAQLCGVMVRLAQMTTAIWDRVERFGYEQPWKFANPGDAFPCRRRFCSFARTCPGWTGA